MVIEVHKEAKVNKDMLELPEIKVIKGLKVIKVNKVLTLVY